MRKVTYQNGSIISDEDDGAPVPKSIYTRTQFISKIPKAKIREIQAKEVTNDDINTWIFQLKMADNINLNNLDAWFIEGLDAMVTVGIFTQQQVDNFLER